MPSGATPTPFSKLLRQHRTAAGLSLYELAKRSGIDRSRIKRMEDGDIKVPTLDVVHKLARALEVDAEQFYDACWETTGQPLPSMPIYFRAKYDLRGDQIEEVERYIERLRRDRPPSQSNRDASGG
ncbi:helix-turn-helix transcriptional regulator [Parafrankia sp. FMc6]|uniref:helix-turn-helix domain-containing protein n=1 Tax=Parafrankia soli TaxID=2599596 RepID=UPI0034D74FB2